MKNASSVAIVMITFCAMLLAFVGSGLAAEDYSGNRLLGADFSGKPLREAKFDGSVLRGAVFNDADLTGASFRKADVRSVSFKGAKGLDRDPNAFRNALYDAKTVWPEGFTPPASAVLIQSTSKTEKEESAELSVLPPSKADAESVITAEKPGYISPPSGIDKHGKDLSNQKFTGYMKGANFDGSTLANTGFADANLEGASFRGARIKSTNFKGANLKGADFSGASLDGPFFIRANLAEANLENQILHLGGWSGYFVAPKLNPDLKYSYSLQQEIFEVDPDRAHNTGLILKLANLKRTVIFGDLATVDFRKADLRGANLSETINAELKLFKGAVYDSGTIWPNDFDPGKAGTVAGEELPALAAATADAAPAPERPKPEGYGMSGFSWIINSPGDASGQLIYIYPDGTYAWTTQGGGGPEGQWKPVAEEKAIVLQQALDGEDWMFALSSPEKVSLRSAKKDLEAERNGPAN